MLFMGIDIGTQGVRGIVCDEVGQVFASHVESFTELNCSDFEGGYEQKPEIWWELTQVVMSSCCQQLADKGHDTKEIIALSIDGTSGTVLPIGQDNLALTPALMYNDMRAKEEALLVSEKGKVLEDKLGLKFNASFALPKILWLKNKQSHIQKQTIRYIHQADYIVGKFCGVYDVTDYSNALKTGYDLVDDCWPDFIEEFGISKNYLPKVIAPGQKIAKLLPSIKERWNLSAEMVVTAGATDGYTSALAAGTVKVGDWASIIGTTMTLKGVTRDLIKDPNGSSYSHKLPSGAWMLGGASNVGGRCLNEVFSKEQFKEMDTFVQSLIPTGVIGYPLTGVGERFPFVDAQAKAFLIGDIHNPKIHYAALLEGVAYAERFAFEQMEKAGAQVGKAIYATGGACKSKEWLIIRASVLNKEIRIPRSVDAAMGCILLAASNTYYSSLEEACEQMISFADNIYPDPKLVEQYEKLYQKAEKEFIKRFNI